MIAVVRRRAGWIAGVLLLAAAAVGVATATWPHWRALRAQHRLLAATVPVDTQQRLDCRALRDSQPLVLLVLGQSNAGNHGELADGPGLPPAEILHMVVPDGCIAAGDPLPGATGRSGSIWTRLPASLRAHGVNHPLVLGLLALDGLQAQAWGEPGSPVQQRLLSLVRTMRDQGLPPRFVLWQQGESDARLGTPTRDWQDSLRRIADLLDDQGVHAPMLLARSTVCGAAADDALGAAATALPAADRRFRVGANTDALTGPTVRHDGCHFTASGLTAAADRWAERLAAELGAPP